MTCSATVTVTPAPSIVVNVGDFSALSGAAIREKLETATPTPVALITATPVTVASWLVHDYGSRFGDLILTNIVTGVRIVRTCEITHDAIGAGDATFCYISASGHGSSEDFNPATPWLDVDLTGATITQTLRIRVTADANGSDWVAVFYPSFLRTP